jgi:hypothetical protein
MLQMTLKPAKLTLFNFPESVELEIVEYFTGCDLISLIISCKKASSIYDRPSVWRKLLIMVEGLKENGRSKKHKKKGVQQKTLCCKNLYKASYVLLWKTLIQDRRKYFSQFLLSSYDAKMRISIHRKCIEAAIAAVKTFSLLMNEKQKICNHNQVLMIHGKTIYPTSQYDSRELMLPARCSSCLAICYDKVIICACAENNTDMSSNLYCSDCDEAHTFGRHHNHPKIEFICPKDYFLQKEYTVGCFECGLAFVARVASNYKIKWQNLRSSKPDDDFDLSTAEFICPSRQNVFRNMLLNYDGKAELLFRMKKGDMLFNHSDEELLCSDI